MVRRLGARNWKRLHRLVYAAAVAATLHFIWLAKVGRIEPYYYVAVLVLLLGVRAADALRRRLRQRREGQAGVMPPSAWAQEKSPPRPRPSP
jgi:sulfoxide reductase heme-binding subunit YedZ